MHDTSIHQYLIYSINAHIETLEPNSLLASAASSSKILIIPAPRPLASLTAMLFDLAPSLLSWMMYHCTKLHCITFYIPWIYSHVKNLLRGNKKVNVYPMMHLKKPWYVPYALGMGQHCDALMCCNTYGHFTSSPTS